MTGTPIDYFNWRIEITAMPRDPDEDSEVSATIDLDGGMIAGILDPPGSAEAQLARDVLANGFRITLARVLGGLGHDVTHTPGFIPQIRRDDDRIRDRTLLTDCIDRG
jgi:hypothetical protein